MAAINELKSDEGEALLEKQYEKISFVGDNTAMAIYLNPVKYKIHTYHNKRKLEIGNSHTALARM